MARAEAFEAKSSASTPQLGQNKRISSRWSKEQILALYIANWFTPTTVEILNWKPGEEERNNNMTKMAP